MKRKSFAAFGLIIGLAIVLPRIDFWLSDCEAGAMVDGLGGYVIQWDCDI